MEDKRVRTSIVLLVVLIMIAGLLCFVPISISVGQHQALGSDPKSRSLQPGFYLIEVERPINLPDGIKAVPRGSIEAGFKHGDARKDKPEIKLCGGDIKSLLLNNGDIKYECTRCRGTWIRSS